MLALNALQIRHCRSNMSIIVSLVIREIFGYLLFVKEFETKLV